MLQFLQALASLLLSANKYFTQKLLATSSNVVDYCANYDWIAELGIKRTEMQLPLETLVNKSN